MGKRDQGNTVNRRDFLKTWITIGAAAGMRAAPVEAQEKKAKVVDIRNPAWRNAEKEVDAKVVRQMMEDGLKSFAGKTSIDDAWKTFVSPNEKICVKFNALSHNYTGANQVLVDAITDGLMKIGVKKGNLFVVEAIDAYQAYRAGVVGS